MSDEIKVRMLGSDELRRGPGGHWYCYEASFGELRGYGQTEMEARRDLETKRRGA